MTKNTNPPSLFFTNADLRRMIVPLFCEQLLLLLVGAADTFMVSFAGEAAVSGVSLVNMLVVVFIYLFTALASGGAVVVSQYIGFGSRDNANLAAGQLLAISLLLSFALSAGVLAFNEPLLRFLFGRVEANVMGSCVIYQRIVAYSFPALAVYNAGAALCRSIGRTDVTFRISLASNLLNVIGNAVGIFVLRAGVAGVAWPTFLARVFSACAVLWLCTDASLPAAFERKHVCTWDAAMAGRIFRIAVPNGVDAGVFQLTKVALSSVTALFGTAQIAANGIAQSFWSLAALGTTVMAPVYITVIGRCMGAGDAEQANFYFRRLMKQSVLLSSVWNAVVLAAVPPVMRFYPLAPEVVRMTVMLVLLHNVFNAFVFPFAGGLPSGLRASGDVRFTMLVSLFTTLVVRLGLTFVFAVMMNLGVYGIAWAMCADWTVRSVLCIWRWKSGAWRQFKVI